MKNLKTYLLLAAAMLLGAILCGIAVWFLVQQLPIPEYSNIEQDQPSIIGDSSETVGTPQTNEVSDTASETGGASEGSVTSVTPATTDDIVITADSLSENQRAILETFGLGDSEFVITNDMMVCAEAKLGSERLTEIINGSAPSPMESFALFGCIKS